MHKIFLTKFRNCLLSTGWTKCHQANVVEEFGTVMRLACVLRLHLIRSWLIEGIGLSMKREEEVGENILLFLLVGRPLEKSCPPTSCTKESTTYKDT